MKRRNEGRHFFFATLMIVAFTGLATPVVRADFIVTQGGSQAKRYDSTKPQTFLDNIPHFTNPPTRLGYLRGAQGVAIGSNGHIYIAASTGFNIGGSSRDNVVEEYDSNGVFIGDFVTSGAGGLKHPQGIAFGPNGDLFVSSALTGSIKEYNGTTGAYVRNFATLTDKAHPEGLVFGPDGNLYVSVYSATKGISEVERFNGTTGASLGIFVANGRGGLDHPVGLAFGPNGDLFVSSAGDSQVKEYVAATGAFARNFNLGGGLRGPAGLVFGPDGNLYVSSYGTDQVKEYNGTTGAFLGNFEDGALPNGGALRKPRYLAFTTPEPSSLALVGVGALALLGYGWRRRKHAAACSASPSPGAGESPRKEDEPG